MPGTNQPVRYNWASDQESAANAGFMKSRGRQLSLDHIISVRRRLSMSLEKVRNVVLHRALGAAHKCASCNAAESGTPFVAA